MAPSLTGTNIMVPHISLKSHGHNGSIYSVNYAKYAPQGTGIGDARINGKDRGYPNKDSNKVGGCKYQNSTSLASVKIII